MNKVFGQGESPYDNEVDAMDCSECLGTGELFVPSDEEGVDGITEKCKCCQGTGVIPMDDIYEDDYVDSYEDVYYDNEFEEGY